jgi:hypothetical protein
MSLNSKIFNILMEVLVDDPIEKDKKIAETPPAERPLTQAEKNRLDFQKIKQEDPGPTPEYNSKTISWKQEGDDFTDTESLKDKIKITGQLTKDNVSLIPGADRFYLNKLAAGGEKYGNRTESKEVEKFTLIENIISDKLLNELTMADRTRMARERAIQANQEKRQMSPQERQQKIEQAKARQQQRNTENAARAASEQAKLKSGELVTVTDSRGRTVVLPPDLARQAQQQRNELQISSGQQALDKMKSQPAVRAATSPSSPSNVPTASAPSSTNSNVRVAGSSNTGSAGGVPRGDMTDRTAPGYDPSKDPTRNTQAAISNVNQFDTPAEQAARNLRDRAGAPTGSDGRYVGSGTDSNSYAVAAGRNAINDRASLDDWYRQNRERQRQAGIIPGANR